MLEFNIRNQEISRIDNFSPAEKSVEYLIAKFNFKTADWSETAKTATFKNLKTKKEYDKIIEDNQCKVPWEVLDENSEIEVSVFGVNGAYTITTDVACFKLNRTLSGGSASTEPTPSTYAQYVKYVAEERQKAESAAKTAEEFAKKAEDASEGKSIDVDDTLSEESTNPVQNKVIAKEVIALQNKNKDLEDKNAELEETIEKLQIKTTTSPSPFHHITDSANMKVVDFGMSGITEQDTVPGNQLFDLANSKGFVSLYSGLLINTCFACFKVVMGFLYQSKWLFAMAGYNMILSIMRFILAYRELKDKKVKTADQYQKIALRSYWLCGWLMVLLNFAISVIVMIVVFDEHTIAYPGYMIYAIAAYSFYCLITAIINVVKYWKLENPIYAAIKRIVLAKALVSNFTLQVAMLTQFGDLDRLSFKLANAATGFAICSAIMILAVFMIHNKKSSRIDENELGDIIHE